ncbi:hypothetical protein ACGFT2_22065 [Streptomyces sp. NPDC048514]|uniref:hypothetical protein n=1 Tax=Streptomyces sp. NPDC048514 TaxID=3365564 RepID=UPI003711381F
MRHPLRRLAPTGAALTAAAAFTPLAPAQASVAFTAQSPAPAASASTARGSAAATPASTSAHCPTSTSIALLPAGSGYLFPNLIASVSACGFTDSGAPYHFTVDTATSNAQLPTGPRTFVVNNLSVVCSAVTANGNSLFATGCTPG